MASLVHQLLTETSQRSPDAPAVWFQQQWVTYGELESASNRLCGSLRQQGIRRGDRVALLMDNSTDYVVSYYGALKCGAITVSLNTDTTSDLVAQILTHAQASAVIASRKYFKVLLPALAKAPDVKLVITDTELSGLQGIAQRTATIGECLASGGDGCSAERVIDIDCASIVYTSGSTGEPKGVMLSHLNVVSNTRSIAQYLELCSSDRIMVVLPFYYVYGKTLLNTHVLIGGSIVIDNRFIYPNVVLDTMEQLRVTGFAGVPSTYMILLQKSTLRQRTFPHLRYVTQAGGAMAPTVQKEVAAHFTPAQLFIMYGATELSPRLTYVPPDRLEEKWGSIGIPIPNTEAFVADEHGNALPPRTEGEIVGRGSNVMMGYWRNTDATQKVIRNGCYFTGDRGIMDEEGFLYVVGRTSDMIKIGGNRVSAKEIEEAILAIAGVVETAVIAVPDPILGEAAKAFVVASDNNALTEESIRESLARSLAMYKIPKIVTFSDSLPKSDSGKIMKKLLS